MSAGVVRLGSRVGQIRLLRLDQFDPFAVHPQSLDHGLACSVHRHGEVGFTGNRGVTKPHLQLPAGSFRVVEAIERMQRLRLSPAGLKELRSLYESEAPGILEKRASGQLAKSFLQIWG